MEARFQEKWTPVFRPEARKQRTMLPGKVEPAFRPEVRSCLRRHRHRHRRHPHPHRRHPHLHRRHPRACPEDLQSAPHPRRALVDPRHKGEDDGARRRRGCDWRRASRKSGHRFSVRKRVSKEPCFQEKWNRLSVRKRSSLRRHRHRRHPHPHSRHPHPHRRHPRACPEDLQSAPHPRRALVDPRHKGEDDGARGRRGCEWRRASRKSGHRFSVRKREKQNHASRKSGNRFSVRKRWKSDWGSC